MTVNDQGNNSSDRQWQSGWTRPDGWTDRGGNRRSQQWGRREGQPQFGNTGGQSRGREVNSSAHPPVRPLHRVKDEGYEQVEDF